MPPPSGGLHVAERSLLVHAISSDTPLEPDDVASLPQTLDWRLVLALAERNRVQPLLSAGLRAAVSAGAVPEAVGTELQRWRATGAVEAQRVSDHLVEVMAAFASADVRALAFKGPALAVAAYGSVARRQYNDLDILIAPDDRCRATAVLDGLGFVSRDDFGWAASFIDSERHRCVDLHTDLLPPDYRHGLDFDRAWSSRRAVPVGNGEVLTFSPAHTLICAGIQVAKDSIENRLILQKVADVAAACRSLDAADWPVADAEADATRLRRITTAAMEIAAHAGCEIGDTAQDRRDPKLAATAAEMLQRLWDEEIAYPKPFVMVERHRRLREHRADGLRPYVRRAFAPGPDHDPTASLPRRVGQRVARPFRMAIRYGARLRPGGGSTSG